MATAGNDDRLYVFEAFGLLLGTEDVPEALQLQWLEAVSAPLRAQIEAAASRGAFPGDAAVAQHAVVALGNIAKGFPLRMATVVRPKISETLRAGLEPALRCLGVWPRDPLTRQRVTAFFQRLVQGVGSQVFPYTLPLVTHLRTDAGAGVGGESDAGRRTRLASASQPSKTKPRFAFFLDAPQYDKNKHNRNLEAVLVTVSWVV